MNKEMYRKAIETLLSVPEGSLKSLEKLPQKELLLMTEKLVKLGDKA